MKRCLLVNSSMPVSYAHGLGLQRAVRTLVKGRDWDGGLILLEHTPVVTVGRTGGLNTFLVDPAVLASQGVEVWNSDRGGSVTCHNPGQLVAYPVLDLRRWRLDAHWYVEQLEEVIIRALREFGLVGGRKARYTGVWHGDRKIAAIGIALKQWITGHGFALNVDNNLGLFKSIVPCGIKEFGVTSLSQAGVEAKVGEVKEAVVKHFAAVFECEFSAGLPGVTDSGGMHNVRLC